jgi:hypothetical protein
MYEYENLYRGKRTDNGEWIQGGLIRFCGLNLAAILESNAKVFMPTGSTVFCTNSCFDIFPETAGRYTGMTDKNDKMIFDGDIVKTKTGRVCIVHWFDSPNMRGWDFKPIEFNTPAPPAYDLFVKENLEVIGNIHDNPELLKGGADNE